MLADRWRSVPLLLLSTPRSGVKGGPDVANALHCLEKIKRSVEIYRGSFIFSY
jgi:hypothetical protein